MSRKSYIDANIVCPFYGFDGDQKIHCEGFSKSTRIQLAFASKEARREHKKAYCKSMEGCKECPLYAVIIKQYEEEGYE